MNGDGIMDIASGTYTGKMYYFPGNGTGFEPRKEMKQVTDVRARNAFLEVMYTNPTFADFNGDGLLDAFVGGSGGIRVMLNEGTKEVPFFGVRTTIYDTNGAPVVPWELTEEQKQNCIQENKNPAGLDYKLFSKLIDWDNDGVMDLISSSGYIYENSYTFGFHKGVKDANGQLKFKKAVPLMVAADGGKALPGTVFMLNVVDVNDDGVLDILFGVSIIANAQTKQIDVQTANTFDLYQKNSHEDAAMKTIGYVLVMYGSK